MLITNQRERVSAWVAERIGLDVPWKNASALGWEEHGELRAGIVIDGYVSKARASMHCAGVGKYWLRREFLYACFDYAFNFLDLKVLINVVSVENKDSLRFTEKIGFSEICRIPLAWNGVEDLVLFQMQRTDCRWLGEQHGIH